MGLSRVFDMHGVDSVRAIAHAAQLPARAREQPRNQVPIARPPNQVRRSAQVASRPSFAASTSCSAIALVC